MKLVSFILPLLSADEPKRKGCDPNRLINPGRKPNYKITEDCVRRRGYLTKPDENGVYLEKPGNLCRWQLQCEFDIKNSITRPIACKCRKDGKQWYDKSECGYAVKYGKRDYGYGKGWRPVDLYELQMTHSYMFKLGDRGTIYPGPLCHDPAKISAWSEWNEWSGCKPAENEQPAADQAAAEEKPVENENSTDDEQSTDDEKTDKEPEFTKFGSCEFGYQTRVRSRVKDDEIEHDKQQVMCLGPMSVRLPCIHSLKMAAHDPFGWFNEAPFYYDMGAAYYDFYPQFDGLWPVGGKFAHE